MKYKIHVTRKATADYIEHHLMNPQAADNLLDKAETEINALGDVVDDPVLKAWGVRFVMINNYMAFYTVDEDSKTINILRF